MSSSSSGLPNYPYVPYRNPHLYFQCYCYNVNKTYYNNGNMLYNRIERDLENENTNRPINALRRVQDPPDTIIAQPWKLLVKLDDSGCLFAVAHLALSCCALRSLEKYFPIWFHVQYPILFLRYKINNRLFFIILHKAHFIFHPICCSLFHTQHNNICFTIIALAILNKKNLFSMESSF